MSVPSENDWRRLTRYLCGEYSPESGEILQEWIIDCEERARLAEELGQVIDATRRPTRKYDVDAAWGQLGQRLEEASDEGSPPLTNSVDDSQGEDRASVSSSKRMGQVRWSLDRRRDRWRTYGTAVIGMALITGMLLLVFQARTPEGDQHATSERTFITRPGQRATIELTDGTQVKLNADTKLTLAPGFSEGQRRVYLEGEAYFDVAKDAAHPFRVQTAKATVEVKGTVFGVRAYSTDTEIQVAVAEGEVVLRASEKQKKKGDSVQAGTANNAAQAEGLVLKAHHLGRISDSGHSSVYSGVDVASYTAWTDGHLVFKDASFTEVIRKIERWYDIEIDTRLLSEDEVDRFNAEFEEPTLDVVLNTVAAALDLEYRRDGRLVIFSTRHAGLQGGTPSQKEVGEASEVDPVWQTAGTGQPSPWHKSSTRIE